MYARGMYVFIYYVRTYLRAEEGGELRDGRGAGFLLRDPPQRLGAHALGRAHAVAVGGVGWV